MFSKVIFFKFVAIIVLMPVWQWIFLATKFEKLGDPYYRETYGSGYEGINLNRAYSYFRPILYYVRRAVIVAILFLGRDLPPGIIISLLIINHLLNFSYDLHFKPIESKKDQKYELFDDITILACIYHIYLFTEYIDTVDMRF